MPLVENMLKRLTYRYNRDPNSNIGKLLGIVAGELQELKAALDNTAAYRDIDTAVGATLDRIGYNVQQHRGQATDGIYRILIKSKIARNLSDGSMNTLIRVLAITLDAEPESIVIQELWPAEPAAIQVDLPVGSLLAAGLTLNQFGRLVNCIVAAGVRANVLQEGTFEFSSIYNPTYPDDKELDGEKGFNGLDPVTFEPLDTGGMLGAVYDPDQDTELPL
ncbi:MAG: hypothetical protein PHP98_10435 [Kiritimatiellae bacterium]|nr:hypothetical protein [Kiritimatiellia bacterium]